MSGEKEPNSTRPAIGPALPPDHVLVAGEQDVGVRLDLFLCRVIDCFSRSQFKKMIQEQRVLVNHLHNKPSYELKAGDIIRVRLPSTKQDDALVPEKMPLDILYEDDELLVVNKAPGIVVHPGAGHERGTLIHGILAHAPKLAMQGAPRRPGIVHRLDRDTSGAMVVAKTERAYLSLIRQFKEHTVKKFYMALAYGNFAEREGEIRVPLGRHPTERKKIAVLPNRGREAVTRWQLEKQWEEAVALLLVTIETGRTHQIRVHLAHVNHPVVGDQTYGGGKKRARSLRRKQIQDLLVGVDRQMLHAWRLAFCHPVSHADLCFEAPLPDDFKGILDGLQ
ncbi:RluA family pseudouridine synthase [Desulfoferrobacter suflitae]|uniref:RluA family pseudouridine synthase n=1 Tax=Desulfoferrobacter suflitae TaxID=2865782 RepID=UPI0021648E3C|nr:RluA family pseudouridine synthase [Desulfoferrobacter suflitae]MCK8600708.1 RluA family pseudouridine synthase [Desulfoferrobacter suflitae]